MATINTATSEKIIPMKAFLGLRECEDGDTKIKFGEATVCDNWRITRDGNLQRRHGFTKVGGACLSYSLTDGDTYDVTDSDKSRTFTMYPTADCTTKKGLVKLSGATVEMDYDNQYANYYVQPSETSVSWVYRFDSVEDADEGCVWHFTKVHAVPTGTHAVTGMWSGYVNGTHYLLITCQGRLYQYTAANGIELIGALDTSHPDAPVHMFGFEHYDNGTKIPSVFFLNGYIYKVFNGTTISDVTGYVPLVSHTISPTGTANAGGTLLEQVNKLNSKRRVWLSPDGSGTTFTLPEKPADDSTMTITATDTGASVSGWTYAGGVITFSTAPTEATDSLEVTYDMGTDYASQVKAMKFSELYSGQTDNRIFIYGDGTNECFYSDIDYNGNPRADYFPDLNEMMVGDANTEITGMIRHYSRLVVFKRDSTWSVAITTTTLADGSMVAGFTVIPVNKAIGNIAKGQVYLVQNNPRTLFGNELYEWRSNNQYSGNLTADERQAKRISDRIYASLRSMVGESCICFDDNYNQEYYICYNGSALVHNYAADAWFKYTNMDAECFASHDSVLYFGDSYGSVYMIDESATSDDGDSINAYWESGSLDYSADYMRKYSSMIWIPVKPQSNSYVEITLMTDKKANFKVKEVTRSSGAGFTNWSFSSLSFDNNIMPKITRLRLKAKKFVYYKIIFQSDKINTNATVLGADVRVRQTGYAK